MDGNGTLLSEEYCARDVAKAGVEVLVKGRAIELARRIERFILIGCIDRLLGQL